MKKAKTPAMIVADPGLDDILPEYDFSHSRPNTYASRYEKGSLVVTLTVTSRQFSQVLARQTTH